MYSIRASGYLFFLLNSFYATHTYIITYTGRQKYGYKLVCLELSGGFWLTICGHTCTINPIILGSNSQHVNATG